MWEGKICEREAELHETMRAPMEIAKKKRIGALDGRRKAFIERSPFLCIGTSDADADEFIEDNDRTEPHRATRDRA